MVHGLDVAVARVRYHLANATATDQARQNAALEFLIGQMALAARDLNSTLLIVFLPEQSMLPAPGFLYRSAAQLGYRPQAGVYEDRRDRPPESLSAE
jgi:hypothetical protein